MEKGKNKAPEILESELSSRNMILAINECVSPIISYSFGVVNWLEDELKQCDINVRKMLHMYRMMHIKKDVDRLYGPRESGGRGLISIWDSYKTSIVRITHAVQNSECEVLQACFKLDQTKLHSYSKKAKKYESESVSLRNSSRNQFYNKQELRQPSPRKTCKRNESRIGRKSHNMLPTLDS